MMQVQTLPTPSQPGPGGPKTLRAEGHIFENCLRIKRCTASCKSTQAAPGTSLVNISIIEMR